MPALGICAVCVPIPAIGGMCASRSRARSSPQVTLDPDTATMSSFGDDADAVEVAEQAVRRFAAQALGITVAD